MKVRAGWWFVCVVLMRSAALWSVCLLFWERNDEWNSRWKGFERRTERYHQPLGVESRSVCYCAGAAPKASEDSVEQSKAASSPPAKDLILSEPFKHINQWQEGKRGKRKMTSCLDKRLICLRSDSRLWAFNSSAVMCNRYSSEKKATSESRGKYPFFPLQRPLKDNLA